jgi:subtilisin-like proprotein convertase family protein
MAPKFVAALNAFRRKDLDPAICLCHGLYSDTSKVTDVDSRSASRPEEMLPVINLSAALARAQEILTPAGKRFEREKVVAMAIPDNEPAGIKSSIEVEAVGGLKRIAVKLNITRTHTGDLSISLISPAGTAVILHDRQGGSRDDLVVAYTSDETEGLAALENSRITGTWTLQVADLSPRDTGTIHDWTLGIDYE